MDNDVQTEVATVGRGRNIIASAVRVLSSACKWIVVVALVVLGLRSALRFESWYDTFIYHLPFAALRGGLSIPYDMSDNFLPWYEGFPPLAHLAQGILWRLTGSVNATGVVGYLAFLTFLIYCHKALRTSFWMVGMIALTAPMVIIHTSTSYVDLFGNSFLAIGLSSCLYLHIFPERQSRTVFVAGLSGLAAAAWSKFFMVPAVGFGFIIFSLLLIRLRRPGQFNRRQATTILLSVMGVAMVPYIQNWINYSNPFWPGRVPIFGGYFPYMIDSDALGAASNRPPPLATASRVKLFIHSLFEIGHPTRYPNRERWVIDQGGVTLDLAIAFRMGGFWAIGVITYLSTSVAMLVYHARKTGIYASLGFLVLLAIISQIPQSHELRYYLFIPLCWAAAIGMTYPSLVNKAPKVAFGFLTVALCFFLYMVSENRSHYAIEVRTYADAALEYGAPEWWPQLKKAETYCAVDMHPAAITLTGPTLSEYRVVDRSSARLCPAGSIIMSHAGITEVRGEANPDLPWAQEFLARSIAMYKAKEFHGAISFAKRAIKIDENYADAYNNLCVSYAGLGKWAKATEACKRATELRPDFELAKNNLVWTTKMLLGETGN